MDTRRRSTALVVAAALLTVLAGACANDRNGSATPTAGPTTGSVGVPTETAASAPTSAPVSLPSAVATTRRTIPGTTVDPHGPAPSETLVTLRGTLIEGVEGGCLILNADNGKGYQLIDLDDSLAKAGTKLEVRGYKAVGMQSICMQGILFKVTSARRI